MKKLFGNKYTPQGLNMKAYKWKENLLLVKITMTKLLKTEEETKARVSSFRLAGRVIISRKNTGHAARLQRKQLASQLISRMSNHIDSVVPAGHTAH